MIQNLAAFAVAAILEILGCFTFWLWLRRGASPAVVALGILSLIGFAIALTRVDAAFAGRAYAAYGGIYIAARRDVPEGSGSPSSVSAMPTMSIAFSTPASFTRSGSITFNLRSSALLNAIDWPAPKRDARYEQVCLIPGFAVQRDGARRSLFAAPSLDHQSNLVRPRSE